MLSVPTGRPSAMINANAKDNVNVYFKESSLLRRITSQIVKFRQRLWTRAVVMVKTAQSGAKVDNGARNPGTTKMVKKYFVMVILKFLTYLKLLVNVIPPSTHFLFRSQLYHGAVQRSRLAMATRLVSLRRGYLTQLWQISSGPQSHFQGQQQHSECVLLQQQPL